jgi:hypothetical protein
MDTTDRTPAARERREAPRPRGGRLRRIAAGTAAALVLAVGTLGFVPLAAHAAPTPVRPSSTATSTTTEGRPQCGVGDLTYHYRVTSTATLHRYGRLVARNTGGETCRTGGYGGLSYVGGGDGTQVGAAAVRQPGTVRAIVLRPGQRAVQQVDETRAQAYPAGVCQPEHVDGFRVYPPDSTAAAFVPQPRTGCDNPQVHQLRVRPYHRVQR